jgi:radical SAM superfamily enzyme YgiQ (UPF0313 family)
MNNALLIYPEFSPFGFWNYKEVCKLVGSKYPAAPLGMITLAALLPKEWNIRLIDMNIAELYDADIDWADLVFIGGMLSQQVCFLKLIDRVHARGKKVVSGGPDPTSQPEVYKGSDYLVLGEAEDTITPFLNDLHRGVQSGVYFPSENKPDLITSPVPRFDLLSLDDYLMIGIQFSRGCPYNCEFCDIIELYGRVPRTKTPQQIINELSALYDLGYRGHIDFVDDNFIGHKGKVKHTLRVLGKWMQAHNYPFFFSTEASINLADDEDLLGLMRDLDFRYVFIGIESVSEEVLLSNQKMQNLNRKLYDDFHRIYHYGMVVNGGYIVGFDDETSETTRLIADSIEQNKICMAMVGLLYALPGTQLARRLEQEKRLSGYSNLLDPNNRDNVDQATSGLNFATQRPRKEIINDFVYILKEVYDGKRYFNRCLRLGLVLKVSRKHRLSFSRKLITIRALIRLIKQLGFSPTTAYYFWRNILIILLVHPSAVEEVVNLMAMYIHFRKQTKYIVELMTRNSQNISESEMASTVTVMSDAEEIPDGHV